MKPTQKLEGFPSGSDGKESACDAGDLGSIPGSGRSPGEGNDNLLQYLPGKIFRQEYWSGLPLPSPGDLLNAGTEPRSPALQVDSLPFEPPGKPLTQLIFHCFMVHGGAWLCEDLVNLNLHSGLLWGP